MQHPALLLLLAALPLALASPFPQAVTFATSPSAAIPSGCTASVSTTFGIAVMTITETTSSSLTGAAAARRRQVMTMNVVTQIGDGQIQAPTAPVLVTQPTPTPSMQSVTMMPISQIFDGQIQAPYNPAVTSAAAAAAAASTAPAPAPAPAATSAAAVALVGPAASSSGATRATTPAPTSYASSAPTPSASASTSTSTATLDPAAPTTIVACTTNSTLALTLRDGVLTDSRNRTGYIASNFQFQFDDPPQSGALYTAGFSLCGNGSLALGGSAVWYQCLSGDFYNLYDRYWAAQCEEVTISSLQLVSCPASS